MKFAFTFIVIWIAYGTAFCLCHKHVEPTDVDDHYLIPKPIDQAQLDDHLIRDILRGLDFTIYLDDLTAPPWNSPKSDAAYILKGLLP